MPEQLTLRNITAGISLFLLLFLSIAIAVMISKMTTVNTIALGLGMVMFVFAFLKMEVAIYFLIFSMLLSPEINFGSMSEQGLAGGRSIVIRLDDIFLILLAFGWLAKSALDKELGLITRSPLNRSIYIYSAVCLFATCAGILYGDVSGVLGTFNVLKYFEYFVLYFLILNFVDTEERARRLIKAAFITCFIITIYAISQIPSGARVTAPFEGKGGEPNTLGGYLLFMMSITSGLFLETNHLYKRVGYAILSLLCLVALLYTESRSSYIGLFFSFIVLAIFVKRRNMLLLGMVVVLIFSSVLLCLRG
ncbi:MAG: hypothetical protein HQ591_04460 [candidate division Zixibacteria bacterium]|nr:hypothetical protein [Candidatus Tariuqbacter arcticus]